MIKQFRQYGLAGFLAFAFTLFASDANTAPPKKCEEYYCKAIFIVNFTKFVSWPAEKAISKQSNVDICILGKSGLKETSSFFGAASANGPTLSLVEEKNYKNAANHCHIVFIDESESDNLDEILNALSGKPVLTVSDIPEFPEKGGMIAIYLIKDEETGKTNPRLAINTKPVNANGLRIDAQLLEVAKVISK